MNKDQIDLSNHAIERTIERFGMCETTSRKHLKDLYSKSIEIYHEGDGRAFWNKKAKIIIITDEKRNVIVTTYPSKDNQKVLDEKQQKEALKKDIGLDRFLGRESYIKDFKIKNIEMYKEIESLDLIRNKVGFQMSELRLRLFDYKDKNEFDKIIDEIELKKMESKILCSKISELHKKRQSLINKAHEDTYIDVSILQSNWFLFDSLLEKED